MLTSAALALSLLLPGETKGDAKVEAKRVDPTLSAAVADLGGADEDKREAAAAMLAKRKAEEIGPLIVPLLDSKAAEVRIVTLRLLRQRPWEKAAREVEMVLRRDADREVRREASHTIGAVDPEGAVAALKDCAVNDLELMVRRTALADLGMLQSLPAAEALFELYQRLLDEQDEYLAEIARKALVTALEEDYGDNLEGWRHAIDEKKKAAEPAGGD